MLKMVVVFALFFKFIIIIFYIFEELTTRSHAGGFHQSEVARPRPHVALL